MLLMYPSNIFATLHSNMLSYQQLQKLIYKIPQSQQQIARQWLKRLQQPIYYPNEQKINEKYTKILQCQLHRLSQGQGNKLEYPLNFMPLQSMLTDIPDFICRKFQLSQQNKEDGVTQQNQQLNVSKYKNLIQQPQEINGVQQVDNQLNQNLNKNVQDQQIPIIPEPIKQETQNLSVGDYNAIKKMQEIDKDLQGLLSDDGNALKRSKSADTVPPTLNIPLNTLTLNNTQEQVLSARQNFYQQLYKSQTDITGEQEVDNQKQITQNTSNIEQKQEEEVKQARQKVHRSFNQEQKAINDELTSLLYPEQDQKSKDLVKENKEVINEETLKEFDNLIEENNRHIQKVDQILAGKRTQNDDITNTKDLLNFPPAQIQAAQNTNTAEDSFSLSVNGFGKTAGEAPVVTRAGLRFTRSKYNDMSGSLVQSLIESQNQQLDKQISKQQHILGIIQNQEDKLVNNEQNISAQVRPLDVQEVATKILQSMTSHAIQQDHINYNIENEANYNYDNQQLQNLINIGNASNESEIQTQNLHNIEGLKQEIETLGLSNAGSTGKSVGRARSTGTLGFIDSNVDLPKTSGPRSKFFSQIDNSFPISYEQTPQYDHNLSSGNIPHDLLENNQQVSQNDYENQKYVQEMPITDIMSKEGNYRQDLKQQDVAQSLNNQESVDEEVLISSGGSYVRVNSVYKPSKEQTTNAKCNTVESQANRLHGSGSPAAAAEVGLDQVRKTLEEWHRRSSGAMDKIDIDTDAGAFPIEKMAGVAVEDSLDAEQSVNKRAQIYRQLVEHQEQNTRLFIDVQREVRNTNATYLDERLRRLELQLQEQDELIRQFFQYAE